MKILAIDSSSVTASVAILEDNKIISEFFVNAGLTHSQTLAPMIESALVNSAIEISDIDLFSATIGPGSFTGLRIGLATLKGMALALNKPCVGVSSLLAAAYNLKDYNGIVCACMDARREQVYNAIFKVNNGKIERITEDRAISIQELEDELSKYSDNIKLVGDGAEMCYNSMLDNKKVRNIELAFENQRYIRGSMVGFASFDAYKRGEISNAVDISLNYLRLSQAERMLLENKLKTQGENV